MQAKRQKIDKALKWEKEFQPWLYVEVHSLAADEKETYKCVCKFCKEAYSHSIGNFSGLAKAAGELITKKDTLSKHQRSNAHLRARDTILGKQCDRSSAPIAQAFKKGVGERQIEDELKIKFNTAYMIAKNELPFSLFSELLLLQKKNGTPIMTPTYDNIGKCAEIIGMIANNMERDLSNQICGTQYVTVLIDGDTDRGIKECEIVYIRYLDPTTAKPLTRLVGQTELEHAHSDGVLGALVKLVSNLDGNWSNKIIGFGADGASVNMGKNRSVSTLLRDNYEASYLVSMHCMAHRLELGILNVQKSDAKVEKVHSMLQLIWKTYHYSPKSRRELYAIGKELDVHVKTPTSVCGTRWAPHVERALRVLLQTRDLQDSTPGQYAAVVAHMEHLAVSSKNADVSGRAKYLCKELKDLSFASFCHFMLDIFVQVSRLSLLLQTNELILPQAIAKIAETIETVNAMGEQPLPGGHLDKFLGNTVAQLEAEENTLFSFQGIELKGKKSTVLNELNRTMKATCQLTTTALKKRFSDFIDESTNMSQPARAVLSLCKLFNHDAWPSNKQDLITYGADEIAFLTDWFSEILKRNLCDLSQLQCEYRELKVLVLTQFMDKDYLSLWSTLLMKEPYTTSLKNVLHLVKIMMVLPISTAQCERGFSTQRRIKTESRIRLHTDTVSDLIRISTEGVELASFDPHPHVQAWLKSSNRPRRPVSATRTWPDNLLSIDHFDDEADINDVP